MRPFTKIRSVAAPLPLDNVDTDQILPARFLSQRREDGYADYCFRDLRFAADGSPLAEFPLSQPRYRGASVLVAGSNFGCGSSREGAVYALMDWGIRAIIAESFGDIFHQNALVNGMLPVVLAKAQVAAIMERANDPAAGAIEIDLEAQRVVLGSAAIDFAIDPFRRHCLLNGVDDIDFTLQFAADIGRYEARHGLA
ncbi:3-isopropylmalate dehydratase small subunit [Phreatobacter sp. AB_2022a]|uniref:3-isopropylmalate dehydratase small subunit n=1 Tax=Phreatobacter sp. AB_2022a TaxID=3003134 RepID=UPI0022870B8E|nr:3-isopropylmalate dehydratase small subunit [Phreatobacter sp. AB_2022a]MCZ0737308.1 3-isopropylmalate dehydratase small subunit [Phreatobacter sp. AB_2022a]